MLLLPLCYLAILCSPLLLLPVFLILLYSFFVTYPILPILFLIFSYQTRRKNIPKIIGLSIDSHSLGFSSVREDESIWQNLADAIEERVGDEQTTAVVHPQKPDRGSLIDRWRGRHKRKETGKRGTGKRKSENESREEKQRGTKGRNGEDRWMREKEEGTEEHELTKWGEKRNIKI